MKKAVRFRTAFSISCELFAFFISRGGAVRTDMLFPADPCFLLVNKNFFASIAESFFF